MRRRVATDCLDWKCDGKWQMTALCAYRTARVDVKRPVAESHLTAMILAAEMGTDTFVARKQGAQSIREFDVLVEDNDALLVAHDIVAVQTVAEFVEIIFALGALVAPGGKDGGADFVWLGRARLVDRG